MDVAMEAIWGKKNQTANNVSANDCTGGAERYRWHKLVKQGIWAATTIWSQASKHSCFPPFFPPYIYLVKFQIIAGCWALIWLLGVNLFWRFQTCTKLMDKIDGDLEEGGEQGCECYSSEWDSLRKHRSLEALGFLFFTQVKSDLPIPCHFWISL